MSEASTEVVEQVLQIFSLELAHYAAGPTH